MLMKSRGDGVIEDNNSSIYSNSNEVANVGSGNGGLGVTVLSILSRDLGDFYSIDIWSFKFVKKILLWRIVLLMSEIFFYWQWKIQACVYF